MPAKRSKQFHRTVSLSQLSDCGARNPALNMKTNMVQIATAASAPEGNLGDAGLQSMLDENMEEEICFGKLEATIHPITDDNSNSILSDSNPNFMPLDHSIEESLFPSHTGTPKAVKSIQQASHLENQMNYEPTIFDTAHGSVQPPPHFLDACYRCSKRLGHGKDVFIYRGDRAFCSVECRHFQIVADERREKCGLTSLKEGLDGANNRARGSPSTAGQVETAAAA